MSKLKAKLLTRLVAVAVMASASTLAGAADASGNLAVSATLTAACAVTGGTISFGSVIALASSADATATSSGFTVACTTGVTPTVKSETLRSMTDGETTPSLLPFNLSLSAGAATNDFPITSETLVMVSDGTPKTIPVYAMISKSVFGSKPAGSYTATVQVDVTY